MIAILVRTRLEDDGIILRLGVSARGEALELVKAKDLRGLGREAERRKIQPALNDLVQDF
jgi:hypothetical protein